MGRLLTKPFFRRRKDLARNRNYIRELLQEISYPTELRQDREDDSNKKPNLPLPKFYFCLPRFPLAQSSQMPSALSISTLLDSRIVCSI